VGDGHGAARLGGEEPARVEGAAPPSRTPASRATRSGWSACTSPLLERLAQGGHELDRKRKLLLHAHEIDEIRQRVDQERLTLVPLQLYFKEGRAKLLLGLGRGRKHYDKRQVIAKRDADMDAKRAMAARRRTE
jgi:hypothetical protein